ncbi:MAG: DUF819 family protein, partial [Pirellulaceae bacterium]|nr:DUF819 family protein [Pirellulaceae bacterium]
MFLFAAEGPLITSTNALVAFFCSFVAIVFVAGHLPFFRTLYRYLPPIVWIYLLPVVFTTAGLTPSSHELYDWCSGFLLPSALLLLTLSTDVKAI